MHADGVQPLRALLTELAEEGAERRLRPPLADPDRIAGRVVRHDGEVLVAFAVADLVEADAVEPFEARGVELPLHRSMMLPTVAQANRPARGRSAREAAHRSPT